MTNSDLFLCNSCGQYYYPGLGHICYQVFPVIPTGPTYYPNQTEPAGLHNNPLYLALLTRVEKLEKELEECRKHIKTVEMMTFNPYAEM